MKETDVYFDDVEINDLNIYLLERHEHPLMAQTRDRYTTIPGTNGAYDYSSDLEPIPFDLPLGIHGNKLRTQQVVRDLKAFLLDGSGKPRTFKLKFGYEPDKYYNVRYSGFVPIERLLRTSQFVLPLVCYEGFANSVVKNDEITWGSTDLTFNAPYTLGHNGDGSTTFTSPGTTYVSVVGANLRPIIHINGTGTNVSISFGDKTLKLGTFVNANWKIDLGEFEISKDGIRELGTINELNPDGAWIGMALQQGENIINVDGSGLNLTFSVEYRDRYF